MIHSLANKTEHNKTRSKFYGIYCTLYLLTHWGRVTHICVSKLTITGSDNGLSPDLRQAIIWTNAGLLLIGPLGTNFSEILIEILTFSFKKMRLKVSSAKWRPFCLGLNVLNLTVNIVHLVEIIPKQHSIITVTSSWTRWRLDCLLHRLFRCRSKRHQSSTLLACVRVIHQWPVPVIWASNGKMFPFDDVIMAFVTHKPLSISCRNLKYADIHYYAIICIIFWEISRLQTVVMHATGLIWLDKASV